jgi:signal transduction histidine kinase
VLKHGGLIHVRSVPAGQDKPSGTVFQVFFPDAPAPVAPAEEKSAEAQ